MQQLVGIDLIFKGWVVKNWANMSQKQSLGIKRINKMIVKYSVRFYSQVWVHRNEVMHDEQKYQAYVIEWYERIVKEIKKENKPGMKMCLKMQKLNVENSESSYIRL